MTIQPSCDVLLVEDDVAQCEEAASFLSRSRMSVVMANTGAWALRQAANHRPRVALIDFNLPDMTGAELAAHLRKMLPEISIVMVSGRIEGLPQEAMTTLGITAFANKPVPLDMLRRGLVKLLSPSRARATN